MVSEAIEMAIAQELAPLLGRYLGVDASRIQLDSRYEEPRILCAGSTLGGYLCNRRATSFAENAGHCHSHIPHEYRGRNLPRKPEAVLNGSFREEWGGCRRIISTYVRASLLRDVPPPEELAYHLLRGLLGGCCLMCSSPFLYPENKRDIHRDHDHETGMVRSLLCRACNRREDAGAFSLKWAVYRLLAPANQWYYRYLSPDPILAQWQDWYPDPVVNRVTCEEADLTEAFCEQHPEAGLARYLEFALQKRRAYVPIVRPYRFYAGKRLVWLGE